MFFCLAPFLTSQTASADDYVSVWQKCETAIRTGYYARQSRKDEIESRFARYDPLMKSVKSHQEFDALMDKMIAEFKDSHFDFLTDQEQGYYMMDGFRGDSALEMPHIGAWFRKVKDGYQVQMLLEGMPAAAAGMRKGDIVQSVNDQPFSPITSLAPFVGKDVVVKFSRPAPQEKAMPYLRMSATVSVRKQKAFEMFLESSRKSVRVIDYEGKKIGYMHLWTMSSDSFRDAVQQAMSGPLANTDAMIFDIRDGFGGRPEGFGDPFFRPDTQIEWKFAENSTGMKQQFGYGRPLAVLINEGSRSAKEVFSAIIKKSGRGILVGNTTGGFVLGTGPNRVVDWAYLELPMVDVIVNGERLEGKGVTPDIKLPAEFAPDGSDAHLAAALKALREKLR